MDRKGTTQQKFNPEIVTVGFDKNIPNEVVYGKYSNSELAKGISNPGQTYVFKTRGDIAVKDRLITTTDDIYAEVAKDSKRIEVAQTTFQLDHEITFDFLVHDEEKFNTGIDYNDYIDSATKQGADKIDKFLADLPLKNAEAKKLIASSAVSGYTAPATLDETNIKKVLDFFINEFSKHKISGGKKAPLYMFVDTAFRLTLKNAMANLITSNNDLVKQGIYEVYERIHFVECDYVPELNGKKLYRISTKDAVIWAHTESKIKEVPFRRVGVKNYIGQSYYGGAIHRADEILFIDLPAPTLTIA